MPNPTEPYLRLHHRKSDGEIVDAVHDLTLADFAGFLPNVGD